MKLKIVAFFFSIYSLNAFAQGDNWQKQTLFHEGKKIDYYVIKQQALNSNELLVLLQGSDCISVTNNPNMVKNFAIAFPKNDILLVEKTGLTRQVGIDGKPVSEESCPVEYMSQDSPLERAGNYIAVLQQLKNDYRNIILLGGSEGATVTNLIASKVDFITASVAINVGGQFFIDDVLYSIKNNTPADEVDNSIEGFKQFAEAVKQKQLRKDQFVSGHGAMWWYEMLTIDNLKLIQSIKTPHLVIQTMADTNVDAYATEKMIQKNHNTNVSFKQYQGLDHFFQDNKGQLHTKEIIRDIQSWYQTVNN